MSRTLTGRVVVVARCTLSTVASAIVGSTATLTRCHVTAPSQRPDTVTVTRYTSTETPHCHSHVTYNYIHNHHRPHTSQLRAEHQTPHQHRHPRPHTVTATCRASDPTPSQPRATHSQAWCSWHICRKLARVIQCWKLANVTCFPALVFSSCGNLAWYSAMLYSMLEGIRHKRSAVIGPFCWSARLYIYVLNVIVFIVIYCIFVVCHVFSLETSTEN